MTANTLRQKLASVVTAAIICLVALPLRGATSPLVLQSTNTGIYVQSSSALSQAVAWGDYDNDGRLDLMFNGCLFHNDGNGQFHQVPSPVGIFSCWIDFDNDGYLDVFSGDRLFRNMGDGTFQQSTNTVFPAFVLGSDNTSIVRSSDYNHDGRPDLFLRGQIEVDGNLVLVLQIWENQGNGQFAQVANQTFTPAGGDVIFGVGDIDNDGWNDIAYDIFNGLVTPQTSVLSVWHNNAGNPVSMPFTRVIPDAYTHSYYFSSMPLVDYNNDGLLDVLAFAGNTGGLVALRNLGSHDSAFGGNSFTNFNFGQEYAGSVCLVPADYDNDGLIDLAAVTYFTGETVGDLNGLYHNDGNDQFSFATVPEWRNSGGGYSNGAWGDYDNDGRIDFFCTQGRTGTNTLYLFRNMTANANTPPTAPTGLVAVAGTNSVRFSWNAATDAQTPSPGLSYNLRVGTAPGTANVLHPSADLATGWRRLPQRGPIQTTFYVMTNLPPGIYYWSVQAIDTAFAGGPFATEGSFIVGGLSLQPAWVQNVASNSAVLFSAATPGGTPASAYFEWGNTVDLGNQTATQDLGSGTTEVRFHAALSGLQPDQFYYFRSVVSNAVQTFRSETCCFRADSGGLLGDLDGDGQISANEAGAVLSGYFGASQMVVTNAAALGGGAFQLGMGNLPLWPFQVQVSDDLNTWANLPVDGETLFRFVDPDGTNSTHRFYRLR